MYEDRQVVKVVLEKIYSRHYDNLVELELVDDRGCGVGKVLTEEDLVFVRDRIDDYIRENFPPNWETPRYWRNDA